jgi:hypothetical protein
MVIDFINHNHYLVLPSSPKNGKKIEIITINNANNTIISQTDNIIYNNGNDITKVNGSIGYENENKIVTCLFAGSSWYIYKNL